MIQALEIESFWDIRKKKMGWEGGRGETDCGNKLTCPSLDKLPLKEGETWADFSTLEAAVCTSCTYVFMK
jgi:hypothetical protein